MKKYSKWLVFIAFLALIAGFFAFDMQQYLNFEYIKSKQNEWSQLYEKNSLLVTSLYFITYVLVTAISLPGAVILTLLGGALFGVLKGTLVISFASTIGATFAFLVSRFLLRDYFQEKFQDKLKLINEGVKKEGGFYLFTLRLIPAFPFFMINLLMGLTPIKTRTYYWVSQLGMLPGTIVYVNAGTQLSQLDSLAGISSPGLIASFAALGLLPLVLNKVVSYIRKLRTNSSGA